MTILILASAGAAGAHGGRFDAAGFDAAQAGLPERGAAPIAEKPIDASGRPIYVSRWESARQTAASLFPGAAFTEEPLLDEIPRRSFWDGAGALPQWLWLAGARLQAAFGNSRQPESLRQSKARADALIDKLEALDRDCVLVTHPGFLAVLLDRFRARGCVAARSGIFRPAPLERVLITRRSEHCGGCSHNCLLSNPGCGVGRDKARRRSG